MRLIPTKKELYRDRTIITIGNIDFLLTIAVLIKH